MKLVALHGQTMNGAVMREQAAAVVRGVPGLQLVAPDAPHRCADELVDRLYAMWNGPRHAPPHLQWWDASDDGRQYRGWEATRDLMRPILADGPVALLGFSQGAILSTALAAMSMHGRMPPIARVVLIAGRPPRADVLRPLLVRPIAVPSLHIWGDDDRLVGDTSSALVELFAPATRTVVTWPGEHAIPTRGLAAKAIVDFIGRR